MNKTIVLIAGLLFLPFPTFAVETSSHSILQAGVETSACEIKAENGDEYSDKQLQTLAKRITVRVIGDNNGGSGTLLAKKGNTYLVVTNSHVVRGVNSISLQTSDGKTYTAQILPNTNFDKFDLALLQFQSNQNYCLPNEIAASVPNTETPVIATGYSSEKGQIVFRKGTIQQIASRPLKEGYQIGYSSDIEQGMSGGAILNSRGELIGINGRSAYPILNTGYVYPDGSRPTESEIKQMRKFSWGIPISTFLAQVNTDILTAYSLSVPNIPDEQPQPKLIGWLKDLEQKAKQFTVKINNKKDGNGSGVIIAQEGNTYTVLTSAHVFGESSNPTKLCAHCEYEIIAPDNQAYPVERSTIKVEVGVDLAVVKFTASNQNYQVATLANYNHKNFDYIFTAGYPKLGENYSPWRLTIGRIFDKEQGLIESSQSDFKTDSSSKLQTASSLTEGYELVYSSITYGGMSGGAVLDSQGRVIGIHGRAEAEEGQVQLGYSLGIPISTFLGIATQLDIQVQKIETTSAPQLNFQQVKSIQEAVLSTNVSQGNTTDRQWLERGNQLWRLRRYQEAVKAFDEAIKQNPDFVHLAYYGKGLALGWDEKGQEAIAALEKAVHLKDNFVAGWTTLSAVYRKSNQLEQALRAIEKAIQLQPKDKQENPNLYNEKWSVLQKLKRYTEAEVAINKAIALNPRAAFFFNRGIFYFDLKKWDLALADYNKAIAINPQYAQAYNNRGILYKELQKWDLALADYNKAIAINPQYAQAYNNRGIFYKELQKWDLALADYNKAIAINPQDAQAYNNRGNLYKELQKWDLALADYNKAIAINPQDAQAYNNRGVLYKELQKWDLALADYNKAIAINPQYAQAYNNRGNLYKELQKWDLALADYNKAIAINPQDAQAYYNRGIFYFDLKKWDLALADFTKAIAINPQYAQAYYNRGIFYYELKKWDLALADFTKAIAINSQDAQAYNNRGVLYKELQKWDLALADYNKAIAINPQYAKAYNNRGNLYYELKKWDLALADFTKAIAINPQYAQAYNNRGVLYKELQKWDLALADYNKAIAINPQDAQAYNNRGIFYKELQKWDLALADFTKAITINPQYAQAYNNRGVLYYELQKWDLALADFTKAITINPQYAQAYYNRGVLYYELQKWDLALADFTKAIAINPQYAQAYYNRGVLYYELQKWDLALADFTKAIAINPQYAQAYYNRGVLYYELQKWDLALADYNKAIAINPQYAKAYNNRGIIYYELKKWDLALADFTKAIAINPQDAQAYNNRGNLYYKLKKWDLALADFTKAIAINPQDAQAYNNQGIIYYEQGVIDKAVKQWQQAIQLNDKLAEPQLALAVALYNKGESEKAYQLAETALRLDKKLADIKFLKENSWGEHLINDAQKRLSSSQIQTLLSQMR